MLCQRMNDSQGQMLLLKRVDSNGYMFTLLLKRGHNTALTDADDDDFADADSDTAAADDDDDDVADADDDTADHE